MIMTTVVVCWSFSPGARSAASIILRGANDFMVDEMERSVHDALCVVKRVLESNLVVPGGGAVETALSIFLENFATSIVSVLDGYGIYTTYVILLLQTYHCLKVLLVSIVCAGVIVKLRLFTFSHSMHSITRIRLLGSSWQWRSLPMHCWSSQKHFL